MLASHSLQRQPVRVFSFPFNMVKLYLFWSLTANLSSMGDLNKKNEPPASTDLQIVETHKLSHHGKVTAQQFFFLSSTFSPNPTSDEFQN